MQQIVIKWYYICKKWWREKSITELLIES